MRSASLAAIVTGLSCLASGCSTPSMWQSKAPDVTPMRAERRQEALKHFETQRDEAQYAAAIERWSSGDPDTCEAQLRTIVARNPKHVLARRALADLALERGNVGQAETELLAIVEFAPDDAQTRHSLGLLLESVGRVDDARQHLARAAELEPDNTIYQFCLQNHSEKPIATVIAAKPK